MNTYSQLKESADRERIKNKSNRPIHIILYYINK
jgi:hypothetical protein